MPQTPNGRPMPEAERATALLTGLLGSVGEGEHTLTVTVVGAARAMVQQMSFHNDSGAFTLDPNEARDVLPLLVLTSGRLGSAVMRTWRDDDTCRVLGWTLKDCTAAPLNRVEIFRAYSVDAGTGELLAPEPGVEYADAPPVHI
ncbi:hypothetical protein [Streptomyces sp. NBC_01361]|uniref:hypothetical protein n=1 Tax=Streptomyces sp. NBC_01361 TaxID=2903838 RepID=UPI002E327B83|nr:hypothetical protein [Streptomyces sp. NBC_01361]